MKSPWRIRVDQPRRTWRLRLSALYCVRTKTRRRSLFRQFERVTSIIRYTPPNGTARLARSRVSGQSRSPCPPARSTPNALRMEAVFEILGRLFQEHSNSKWRRVAEESRLRAIRASASASQRWTNNYEGTPSAASCRPQRNKALTWGLASDRRIWQLPVLAHTGYTRLFPSVQFNHQQGTGVKSRGRSCHSRRRIFGERAPALQAEGAVGRHQQGNQEAQLLHEARGKASSQGSPFTQTPPQKAAARAGLGDRVTLVW